MEGTTESRCWGVHTKSLQLIQMLVLGQNGAVSTTPTPYEFPTFVIKQDCFVSNLLNQNETATQIWFVFSLKFS